MKNSFADAIRNARREKNYTLREMSGWTGIPVSMLSEMERGKRLATQDKKQIRALSKLLGIDINTLSELAGKMRL